MDNNNEVKSLKWIIWLAAAAVALAAAITAIIFFRTQLLALGADLKEKIIEKKDLLLKKREFDNYADI